MIFWRSFFAVIRLNRIIWMFIAENVCDTPAGVDGTETTLFHVPS